RLVERAEDLRRLTAPLRALGQALIDGRSRARRRSGRRHDDEHGEESDPAAAI
ncbi:MAG TPA: TetR/AcrR family transcriptional regulator, partial [Enterovirga sp.]